MSFGHFKSIIDMNIGFTFVNGLGNGVIGTLNNQFNNFVSGGNGTFGIHGGGGGLKLYYDKESGGNILEVLVKTALIQVADQVKTEVVNYLKDSVWKAFHGSSDGIIQNNIYQTIIDQSMKVDVAKYGTMIVNNGQACIDALDLYGEKCEDALMLGIPVKDPIEYTISKYGSGGEMISMPTGSTKKNQAYINIKSDTLVWYDTTATIRINSEKNLIVTRVVGRDYSRKELISNGDIEFTVNGTISSNIADVYPANEVKKFIQIMKYKGIVKVNNQMLDQFGIDGIVIKGFSLDAKDGFKNQQNYTFSAVGIMPKSEVNVMRDTIVTIDRNLTKNSEKKNKWSQMLNNKLEGISNTAIGMADQGLAIAGGLLK